MQVKEIFIRIDTDNSGTIDYSEFIKASIDRKKMLSKKKKDKKKDKICSCGHKVIECDCAAGCKCGCRNRYLGSHIRWGTSSFRRMVE